MKHSARLSLFLRHWHIYAFLLIFILGCGLRFIHLSGWMWDMGGYDESRDMLIASHLVEHGDWVWRGPLAAGGFNILANSPFYYYFIAAIWAVSRTPEVFMVVWAIVMASIIPLGYTLGNRLWDKPAGLYIALLFAVHPTFVEMGKFLSQVNLVPLWVVIVLNMLISKKRWGYVQLLLGLTVIFLGLHIHYGSLLVVGSFFIWQCWIWWHDSNISSPILRIISVTLVTLCLVWVWVYSTYKYAPFDQFLFIVLHLQNAHPSNTRMALEAMKSVGTLLWIGTFDLRAMFFGVIGIVGYVFGFASKLFSVHVRNFFIWGLVCIVLAYIMVGIYLGRVPLSYLYSLLPFYIVMYGIFFRRIYESNRFLGVIIFVPVIAIFSTQSWQRMQPQGYTSNYLRYKDISTAIVGDYRSLKDANRSFDVPSFIVETFSTPSYAVFDEWANGSAWYWVEKMLNKKLVTINAEGNFQALIARPRYAYIICDHGDAGRSAIQSCLHKLSLKNKYILSVYDDIFSSDYYTVWRFRVMDSMPSDSSDE